jgi:hypothetical protein
MAKIISYKGLVVAPRFVYNVKFVCGVQKNKFDKECSAIINKGLYFTEINILNFGPREVRIAKLFTPLVIKNEAIAIEPKTSRPVNAESVTLPPLSATMDDCCKLGKMLNVPDEHLKIGFLEIISPVELEVVAVYTVSNLDETNPSMEVVQIQGKRFGLR